MGPLFGRLFPTGGPRASVQKLSKKKIPPQIALGRDTSLHGPKIVPSFWAPKFADKGEAQQLGFTFACEFLGPYTGQQKGAKK